MGRWARPTRQRLCANSLVRVVPRVGFNRACAARGVGQPPPRARGRLARLAVRAPRYGRSFCNPPSPVARADHDGANIGRQSGQAKPLPLELGLANHSSSHSVKFPTVPMQVLQCASTQVPSELRGVSEHGSNPSPQSCSGEAGRSSPGRAPRGGPRAADHRPIFGGPKYRAGAARMHGRSSARTCGLT